MKQNIIISRLTTFFQCDTKRILGAVLIGSFARGQGTISSDIDIELLMVNENVDRDDFIRDIVQLFREDDDDDDIDVKHTIWLNDQRKLALYHGSDLLLTELYLYGKDENYHDLLEILNSLFQRNHHNLIHTFSDLELLISTVVFLSIEITLFVHISNIS